MEPPDEPACSHCRNRQSPDCQLLISRGNYRHIAVLRVLTQFIDDASRVFTNGHVQAIDDGWDGSCRTDGERSMSTQAWICALAMVTTAAAGAKENLSMRVSPTISFAPANLVIQTRLEPDAANRGIEVIAESGDFYRSSEIQLEGDRAPRTVRFEFRSLPAGEYQVRAAVLGTDGQRRALARSRVNVMETGASR